MTMSEDKKKTKLKFGSAGTLWNYSLLSALIVIIIMVLLQPFGLDRVEHNKYFIILGYGILTILACIITKFVTLYIFKIPDIFKIPENILSIKDFIIGSGLIVLLMGFFITNYAPLVYTGSIYPGWYTRDGIFSLSSFWTNCGYSIIISFFVSIFLFFYDRSKRLSQRLKEEIELNKIINQRIERKKKNKNNQSDLFPEYHEIILTGNTKGSVKLYIEDLLFIESDGNYTHIFYLQNGRLIKKTLRCTLKQMENLLTDYSQIIRCHRAFLINILHITHVEGNAQGYRLEMEGTSKKVPVSRAYASKVYQRIEA